MGNNGAPKDKSLYRIDYGRLKKRIGRQISLYRGTLQKNFERRILESISKGKEPSYYGYCNNLGDKLTFFTSEIVGSICYIDRCLENRHEEMRKNFENGYDPFTVHGLVLKVNPGEYKNRLYGSREGEGIVILGDILAKDIEIVYSKDKDKIIEEQIIYFLSSNGYVPNKSLIEYWKNANIRNMKKSRFAKEDIFTAIKKDPDRIESICDHIFGMKIHPHPGAEKEIVKQGLQLLKLKVGSS